MYWSYATFMLQSLVATAYPRDPSAPSGVILTSGDPSAPTASITRAFQWAPAGSSDVYLILTHQFAQPVTLKSVQVTEPAPTQEIALGTYGQFLNTGYTYLVRTDGNQFLEGDYQLLLQATLLDGTSAAYSGTVTVGPALPTTPPAASMASAGTIFDSTLTPAIVSAP